MRLIPFTFRAIEEHEAGAVWQGVFDAAWPDYRRWFLQEGEEAPPPVTAEPFGFKML